MKIVNMHEAKTPLSKLVEEVVAGETVIVAKAGKPMVKLTKIGPAGAPKRLGLLVGQGRELPGCWGVQPELEDSFYDNAALGPAPKVAE